MNKEEAYKIYSVWKEYIEIGNKLNIIFRVVPESFLPYPVEVLKEALEIVTEDYFDSGNHRMSNNIKELMSVHLGGYYIHSSGVKLTDEEILEYMQHDLNHLISDSEFKNSALKMLKDQQNSWIDNRNKVDKKQ